MEEKYNYWFGTCKGISDKKKIEIVEKIKSPQMLYNIEEKEAISIMKLNEKEREAFAAHKKNWALEKEYEKLQISKAVCIPYQSKQYPEQLKQIKYPPYALYVKGKLPDENKPSVAIVGARKCTPYGREITKWYAQELAKAGVQIISGMAYGIDETAQNEVVKNGGNSFAVLGCGANICYPREQFELYMELQEKGGIISEFGLSQPPLAQHFPARNRIISALSQIVLVMEAKERSGSLITSDMALEQGKDVYALPGPVNSEYSRGCHRLIAQGAGILLSPEEIIEELGIYRQQITSKLFHNEKKLETKEELVYSCLDLLPKGIEKIQAEVKMDISDLVRCLIALEMKGLVREVAKNHYIKMRQ